jgi:hypothetical protein
VCAKEREGTGEGGETAYEGERRNSRRRGNGLRRREKEQEKEGKRLTEQI